MRRARHQTTPYGLSILSLLLLSCRRLSIAMLHSHQVMSRFLTKCKHYESHCRRQGCTLQ